MRGLVFGALLAVGLAAWEGDASAALTAQPAVSASAPRATARPATTLAKAKKKKRSGGASSGGSKSDADDSGAADDDAGGKSSTATGSGGADDPSKEDELLGSGAKPKKAVARDDGDASSGGGGGDGAEAPPASGKSVETVAAKSSPDDRSGASPASALEFGVGAKALFRSMAWTADATAMGCSPCLGPYALTPGPETGLWLEFYPAALGTSGFAANVGLVGSFNYGFGVATTLANGNEAATKFRDFLAGVKVRIPVGTFIPNVTVSYGQQVFEIAPRDPMRDIPQVAYSFVRPSVGTRVLLRPTVVLDASAGYLQVLDPGSGANHVRATNYFPNATSFGFDVSASVAFRVAGAIGLRVGADLRQYVLNMNDKTAPTIGGAVDRYITAWAGVEVVLDGQGAAADDEPAKPSKRKRRHAPEPKADDDSASDDDASSKSEEE